MALTPEQMQQKRELLQQKKALLEQQRDLGTRKPDIIDKVLPTGLAKIGRGPADFEPGQMNLIGDVFERPSKAIKAGIQAISEEEPSDIIDILSRPAGTLNTEAGRRVLEATRKGFEDPESVKTFRELSAEAPVPGPEITEDPLRNQVTQVLETQFIVGLSRDALAEMADVATNPALLAIAVATNTQKVQKLGQAILESKPGQALARSLTKQRTPVKDFKNFLDKFKSDFIDQKLTPKLNQLYSNAIEGFNSSVQKFILNSPKINVSGVTKPSAVKHIAKRGTKQVRATRQLYDDSTGSIQSLMERGFGRKEEAGRLLYKRAMKGNNRIDTKNFFPLLKKELRKVGFIDEQGNATRFGLSETKNKTLGQMLDIYESFRPTGIRTKAISTTGNINKFQWQVVKDDMTKLYKSDPNQRGTVKRLLDAFHKDAEQAGFRGITKARNAHSQLLININKADKFLQKGSLAEKGKLENIFNIEKTNPKQLQNLREVENYLNLSIETPAKDIMSSRLLDKLDEVSMDSQLNFGRDSMLSRQLKDAVKSGNRKRVKTGIESVIGKSAQLDSIFQDLKIFRRVDIGKKVAGGAALLEAGRRIGIRSGTQRIIE